MHFLDLGGQFLAHFAKNDQKLTAEVQKMQFFEKLGQKIKNVRTKLCGGHPGERFKKKLGQLDHSPRSLRDFARKIAYRKLRRQISKNGGFRAKKWPIFARFRNFFRI